MFDDDLPHNWIANEKFRRACKKNYVTGFKRFYLNLKGPLEWYARNSKLVVANRF